ncbi:MAG TPA: hypothetical protein VJ672_08670 [Gemmatimonadaceae bacterium]|nr:hypothetical protein [Gemmatimonadaceae bacterium]
MRPAQIVRLISLLAVTVSTASAQELTPGARVRVSAPDFGIDKRKGTLVRMTRDSVTIDLSGRRPIVTLPIRGIVCLDVSRGKHTAVGFVNGAFIGVLAGGLTGAWLSQQGDCGHMCGLAGMFGLAAGGAIDLVFGGAIGVRTAPDRWEEVSLHRQARELGLLDATHTTKLGFRIAF